MAQFDSRLDVGKDPYNPHIVEFADKDGNTTGRFDLKGMTDQFRCVICGSYKETDVCIRTVEVDNYGNTTRSKQKKA